MSAVAAPSHDHVDGTCATCRSEGYAHGSKEGYDEGYERATVDGWAHADEIRSEALAGVHEAVREAHREARHEGPWEYCSDPVCSALERWFHFEGVR